MNTPATTKKHLMTVSLLVLLFAGAGCSGSSSPSETAKSFLHHASEGNAEQAAGMVFIPEEAPAGAEQKVQAVIARQGQRMQQKDGVDDLEVLEESVNAEEATVEFRMTYGNGDTEEESFNLVKKEAGWKIKL